MKFPWLKRSWSASSGARSGVAHCGDFVEGAAPEPSPKRDAPA